jgi:hypothetical protein
MSNQVIKGRIDAIRTKQVNTKFGDKSVYIAVIGNQEVNLGFKHNFSEGETVSIEAEHKYGSLQYVGPAQAGAVATPASATPQGASAGASNAAFPVKTGANGTSICRQSSLKAALEYYGLPGTADAPTIEDVIQTAYIFTDFATGQREMKAAKAAAEQQATPQAVPVMEEVNYG